MNWTMILNDLFAIMGLASGGVLVYGGWICMRHLAGDWPWSRLRESPAALHWLHIPRAE